MLLVNVDAKKLAIRQPPSCDEGVNDPSTAHIENVVACFNYLVLVGHSNCPATAGLLSNSDSGGFLCKAGDAQIGTKNTFQNEFAPTAQSAW